MTNVPTTALTLADIAPDPSPLTTGASPVTLELGPRLYRVTTGGTGGSESIVLPTPSLPLDSSFNDQLVGLRIAISLGVQTDPADVVTITAESGNISIFTPLGFGIPQMANITLTYVGGAASFVWALDGWALDSGATDSNFNSEPAAGQPVGIYGQTAGDGSGGGILIFGAVGTDTGNGGDVIITIGQATGSGANGVLRINHLPTVDPANPGAIWNNSGVLTVSAG